MSEPDTKMPANCPLCGAALPAGALGGLCPACLLQQGASTDTATRSGKAPFEPPSVTEIAKLFPQLEIQGFIGKGGMGAVYKARQPALDRLVALKILPRQTAGGSNFVERFNREARALAKLNHPNIVTLYEFGQADGLPFFMMEYVDGLNLRQLERAGRLSPREALQIVPQICEALQFAHDEGIVHRDIKPENILLDKKGRVKIADFGIAKIVGGEEGDVSIAETNEAIGTPRYMAPEQVSSPQAVDHRADIYSLGVVFYEMLTGELPQEKVARPSSRSVQVDVRLDEVILRAMEEKPELRFQKASEVKTVVETIAENPRSGSAPGAGAQSPPKPASVDEEAYTCDYELNISSCLSRGWELVLSDFWPIVGVTALMTLLLHATWSTGIGLVVSGPLAGGLSWYYLKKIRREEAKVETAFQGFSIAFVPLLLGGLITSVLTFLGYLCLILPGIYLSVAWMFPLTLIIDKRMEFWPAMRLSRKVVGKHWWKFFGLWLISILLYAVGVFMCVGIGFIFTAPFAFAAATYAYEDAFGSLRIPARPGSSVRPTTEGGGLLKPVVIGLAIMVLFLSSVLIMVSIRNHMRGKADLRAAEEARISSNLARNQPWPSVETQPSPTEQTGESVATKAARLKLAAANEELEMAKLQANSGNTPGFEYRKLELARDIAAAELKGDSREVARLKLQAAEEYLDATKVLSESGRVGSNELIKAKLARDLAELEYSQRTEADKK